MKYVALVLSGVLVLLGILIAQDTKPQTVQLTLSGLHCQGCVTNVDKALRGVDGVRDVSVDLKESSATVVLASASLTTETLLQAVADAGYQAELKTEMTSEEKPQADACCAVEGKEKMKTHAEKKDECCATETSGKEAAKKKH